MSDVAGEIYTWISLPVKGAQTHYFFQYEIQEYTTKRVTWVIHSNTNIKKNEKLLNTKFATYILVIYYWNIPDVTAIYDFSIVLAMVLECAMI